MAGSGERRRIVIAGGAGLVGQNLVARLSRSADSDLVVLDKHEHNLAVLERLFPDVRAVAADCAEEGEWMDLLAGADAVIMLQAQIGSNDETLFYRNNVQATERLLACMQDQQVPYLVHVSSSVVNSVADDHYTRSKTRQEEIVDAAPIRHVVLRPTLMFGWFDRKHLGWLARLLKKVPVFPIPSHGRFARQPLYVQDLCAIISTCIDERREGTFDISGREHVDYVDLIKLVKAAVRSRALLLHIPFGLFDLLLRIWAMFDRDPPFTSDQLHALVAGDEFEVIDWPAIFGVQATPVAAAIAETFTHAEYSSVELKF